MNAQGVCYPWDANYVQWNSSLRGTAMGEQWQPHHIERLERQLGERKETERELVRVLDDHKQRTAKLEEELRTARGEVASGG